MNMNYSNLLHNTHYATLYEWAKQPAPRPQCVVFLYGPPGVGKTTLAHRVINDVGLRAVECNASQFRHKAAMSELIEPLLNSGAERPQGVYPLASRRRQKITAPFSTKRL